MVETAIRTPDPADRQHKFVARTAFPELDDTSCNVCGRGSGHTVHDVHAYVPWVEDGAEDRYLNPRLDERTPEIHTGTVECCAGCERALYATPDMVNHPPHYTAHPSGVEVIQITEHLNFCLGNVVKYVLRADLKGDALADLEKAAWYLAREIKRRKAE